MTSTAAVLPDDSLLVGESEAKMRPIHWVLTILATAVGALPALGSLGTGVAGLIVFIAEPELMGWAALAIALVIIFFGLLTLLAIGVSLWAADTVMASTALALAILMWPVFLVGSYVLSWLAFEAGL